MSIKNSLSDIRVHFSRLRETSFNAALYVLDRSMTVKKLASLGNKSMVFLYYPQRLPLSQCYPFYFYRRLLNEVYGVDIHFVNFQNLSSECFENIDYVCFQTWFGLSESEASVYIAKIRSSFPKAKYIYFDWFAPTSLEAANRFGGLVDLYVKKNLLKDFEQYSQPTYGDTNLANFYDELLDLKQPLFENSVPPGFQDKVILGPGFITGPFLMSQAYSVGSDLFQRERHIDLSARLGGGSARNWYGAMRRLAIQKIERLPEKYCIKSDGVLTFGRYYQELRNSKMTFSPFGYGEVCWRDYESILSGSLLLKPSMGHMYSEPDIFVDYETYVPLKWDFSDLEAKMEFYKNNVQERERICKNALSVLKNYVEKSEFCKFFEKIL